MSDKMRGEFEERFPVPVGVEWRDGAYHISKPKQITLAGHMFYLGRWEAWQASRESLVIELPQRWSVDGFESGWVADPDGANLDYSETVKAIEAAGLKVKS